MNETLLVADAKNRAWRTFLVNIGVDVAVALAVLLTSVFAQANDWSDLDWQLIAFSSGKTVLLTIGAYVMRRWLDPSKFPTPLPPEDPGKPADDPAPGVPRIVENGPDFYVPQNGLNDDGTPITKDNYHP